MCLVFVNFNNIPIRHKCWDWNISDTFTSISAFLAPTVSMIAAIPVRAITSATAAWVCVYLWSYINSPFHSLHLCLLSNYCIIFFTSSNCCAILCRLFVSLICINSMPYLWQAPSVTGLSPICAMA